jgi:hypothetical protein
LPNQQTHQNALEYYLVADKPFIQFLHQLRQEKKIKEVTTLAATVKN